MNIYDDPNMILVDVQYCIAVVPNSLVTSFYPVKSEKFEGINEVVYVETRRISRIFQTLEGIKLAIAHWKEENKRNNHVPS